MGRLALILVGLFCGITAVMMVMNHGNPDMDTTGLLAESFYYTAIAFAVYHLINKTRQHRQS